MSDLQELFRRDPFDCSKQDDEKIVEAFRARRAQFNLGNISAGNVNKKLTAKEEESAAAVKKIDLSSLGL